MAIALPAQTFTTLYSFDDYKHGYGPGLLVQGTDGNLYGTTIDGGANNGYGTVFKITPNGKLTTLHSFDGTDGASPYEGLVQGTDGDFYGTTDSGGANDAGTVFKITPNGRLTTLYSFDGTDGYAPSVLVQGINGNFFGTTLRGGANDDGAVFKITPNGKLTTLHSFDGVDGEHPVAGLIQDTNGSFFGTTYGGGTNSLGTVFKITPNGKLTTLHSFDGTDGEAPGAELIQGTDGDFYGTTDYGGINSCDGLGCGTVFKITRSGGLTTLYDFCSQGGSKCTDGSDPEAALIQATNGNFYGATNDGGTSSSYCYTNVSNVGCGTIFEITSNGKLATVHSFCSQSESSCPDGYFPEAALVQDTNGTLYGTTPAGGANTACNAGQGCGTVFSLSVGLGPFVKTTPTVGNVGTAVTILGTGLGHATNVRFNGLEAKFTIVSASEITTTVPNGATTGPVRVITPSGKLQSNVPFHVD